MFLEHLSTFSFKKSAQFLKLIKAVNRWLAVTS